MIHLSKKSPLSEHISRKYHFALIKLVTLRSHFANVLLYCHGIVENLKAGIEIQQIEWILIQVGYDTTQIISYAETKGIYYQTTQNDISWTVTAHEMLHVKWVPDLYQLAMFVKLT